VGEQWLPVLDVSLLLSKDEGALELRTACETIGFYFLENYEELLPQSVVKGMLEASAAAHALPTEHKEEWWLNGSDSGFMPVGATTRWGSTGRPQLPEHDGVNEAVLFWGNGPPWVPPERQLTRFSENQLPQKERLPGFREAVQTYLDSVE
ncbi:unnamed protein product, partial [Polarella glacialis]